MNSPIHSKSRGTHAAFTLIELLVVIGIIGILAALILSAISGVNGKAIRTKCLSNLKQIALGSQIYGNENRDRLPAMQGGNWAWDLPVTASDVMLRSGLTQDVMYDPGFPEMATLWNFAIAASPPYRVIGFALTFPGTASLIQTNTNPTLTPQQIQIGMLVLPAPDPSRRVLAAGATISMPGENNTANRALNHYTGIMGGAAFPHRAAHLDQTGKMPLGDNVAMLDGSGKWRKFQDMTPRTQGASPVFWW